MADQSEIFSARIPGKPDGDPATPLPPPDDGGLRSENDDFFRDSLAIIGPPQSGKTALVISLPQACRLRKRGEPSLSIIPEKTAGGQVSVGAPPIKPITILDPALLFQGGIKKISEKSSQFSAATDQPYAYPLSVNILQLGVKLKLRVVDGPGGGLFPNDLNSAAYEDNFPTLCRACARADKLLLCVSSTGNDAELLAEYLDRMLEEVIAHSPFPGELPFMRVLVMLTKIDRLALSLIKKRSWLGKPRDAAELVSPRDQVREIVGPGVLDAIRTRLPLQKGATMAVGLSSAAGFDAETGNNMIGLDGQVIRIAFPEVEESKQSMLGRWRPYGVREALYFLAGGEPRGPITYYTEDDSYIDEDGFSPTIDKHVSY